MFHNLISSNPAQSGNDERKEVVRMTASELATSGLSAFALVLADLSVLVFATAGPD
ncbi:MAG TPA: hypothetical protein VFK41_08960 [Nocardioidaceae bacterium]|nr:hypothetical protein [Nocardioidaceae bacterium]